MKVVCQKCNRILIDNKWIVDLPPIEKASYTICPDCQGKKNDDKKTTHGMVFQEYKHQKDKSR